MARAAMRSSEWIVLGYLLYLVVSGLAVRLPAVRVRIILAGSALGGPVPTAGTAFGAVAVAISAGAVAGHYHYAVDVVLGALVGTAAALVAGTCLK